ncbi:MAG: hypothetical protein HY854_18090 [Burkholderiales bacterium]|nr:hypothetical protein [Burkholderiales bacterium]
MKQLATVLVVALACTLSVAAESTRKSPQQARMAQCQKEATASGKTGKDRSELLRACLSAKKPVKAAKSA